MKGMNHLYWYVPLAPSYLAGLVLIAFNTTALIFEHHFLEC